MAITRTHETITDLSSAVALPNIPSGCDVAVLQADTQNVRYRLDGTNPTSSVGLRIIKDSYVETRIVGKLADVRVIEETSGAQLNIMYQVTQDG